MKLDKPQKSLSDAQKQAQDKLNLLGDSELKGLVQKISGKGREEAKTQIEYLVSGQAGLDETKNRLREIERKLLEAFKDELGDEKQALESCEAEELVVEIRLS